MANPSCVENRKTTKAPPVGFPQLGAAFPRVETSSPGVAQALPHLGQALPQLGGAFPRVGKGVPRLGAGRHLAPRSRPRGWQREYPRGIAFSREGKERARGARRKRITIDASECAWPFLARCAWLLGVPPRHRSGSSSSCCLRSYWQRARAAAAVPINAWVPPALLASPRVRVERTQRVDVVRTRRALWPWPEKPVVRSRALALRAKRRMSGFWARNSFPRTEP